MSPFLHLVLAAWWERFTVEGPRRGLAFVLVGAALYALRGRLDPRDGVRRAIVLVLALASVGAAASRASVVDDAFIALRYARNLLDGHGLVFNVGERVEGYTDLLWVLLVAAGSGITGVELPLVALVLNLAIVAANIVLVAANARRLSGYTPGAPLAAVLLAGHAVFIAHGTTGLETGLLALLVQAALYALSGPPTKRAAFTAGVALVLAVLTRPDAALFLPVAAIAVALPPSDRLRRVGSLALPGLALVSVEVWRLLYYGDWLPNTAYTKSAGGAYWSQGFVYLTEFWLGSASLPLLVVTAVWAVRGTAPLPARVYVSLATLLQIVYVTRVGGDFMSGRFFVVLLPLLVIAAECAWRELRARPLAAAAVAALLLAGLGSGSLQRPGYVRWYIADEGSLYRVVDWSPVTIDHISYAIGNAIGDTMAERGIEPTIAVGTIGMVGYYGHLPLIDLHGLTDRFIARRGGSERGHIGHEKMARLPYLLRRNVRLVQSQHFCGDERWAGLRTVTPPTGAVRNKTWCFLRWDPTLAAELRARAPEWRIPDPDGWIRTYVAGLRTHTPQDAAETLTFLDEWYAPAVPDFPGRSAIAARAGHP